MTNGTPGGAVRALAEVLKRLPRSGPVVAHDEAVPAAVRVVSYSADFEFLWSVGSHSGAGFRAVVPLAASHLVVLWDAMPPGSGSVNVARHLTPLDWAVSFACSAADRGAPELRVWVIDRAAGRPLTWFDDIRSLLGPGNVPGLPWVRVLSQSDSVGPVLAGVAGIDPPVTLAAALADPANAPRFERLRWLWRCGLTATAPEDRHALSNLLGPLLVLGADGRPADERAAHRLAADLGLTDPALAPGQPWVDWARPEWKSLLDQLNTGGAPLRALLVDDAAFTLRWAEVLCAALGAKPPGTPGAPGEVVRVGTAPGLEVYATDSAAAFAERFHEGRGRFGAGFLAGPGDPGSKLPLDVLFLDLRLHQAGVRADEAASFEAAVDLARRVGGSPGWPPITDGELNSVGEWVALVDDGDPRATDDHPGYLRGLSLLARAVALADPTLPVVLFTSTRRRNLMTLFEPYRTILGGWEKPGLATGSQVADARDRFGEVFGRALRLAAARRAVRRILDDPPPVVAPPAGGAGEDWVVEVLLDETGGTPLVPGAPARAGGPKPGLTVGGLVVCYPAARAAEVEAKAGEVYALFANRWGESAKRLIRNGSTALLKDLDVLVKGFGGALVPVWLTCNEFDSRLDSADALRNLRHADNLHRDMTRTAIELGLFWVAPALVPAGAASVTADVRAATRRRRLAEFPEVEAGLRTAAQLKHQLETEWGEWVEQYPAGHADYPGEYYTQVINFETPRAFVEDVVRPYAGTRFFPRVRLARAFPLSTPRPRASLDDPTALHLLADAAVGPDRQKPIRAAGPGQEICRHAFRGDYGPALLKLLEAGRLARRGLVPEALAAFAALRTGRKLTPAGAEADGPRGEFHNLILAEVLPLAANLTGAEFVRCAELLAQQPTV
jgi:hypothetical protein